MSQVTWTAVVELVALMEIAALPSSPSGRRTSTTRVTLWPASSCPDDRLIVRPGDDAPAVQLTGPPLAVSTIWPVESVPRSRCPWLTSSWPDAGGLAAADGGTAAAREAGETGEAALPDGGCTAGLGSSATPMARCGVRAGMMTEGAAVAVARVSCPGPSSGGASLADTGRDSALRRRAPLRGAAGFETGCIGWPTPAWAGTAAAAG